MSLVVGVWLQVHSSAFIRQHTGIHLPRGGFRRVHCVAGQMEPAPSPASTEGSRQGSAPAIPPLDQAPRCAVAEGRACRECLARSVAPLPSMEGPTAPFFGSSVLVKLSRCPGAVAAVQAMASDPPQHGDARPRVGCFCGRDRGGWHGFRRELQGSRRAGGPPDNSEYAYVARLFLAFLPIH